MTISKRQQGFAVWEMLLILLVFLLLLLGAWFVWQKNKKDDETKKDTISQTQQSQAQEQTPETPEQAYLEIKEWGVRFQLAVENVDAYYAIESGKPDYAYLSVHSLTNPECAPNKTSVGAITRFKQGDRDPISDELYTTEVPDATKVGNYYYFFSHAQAYCDEGQEATLKAVASAFEAAVKTAEPAQ